MAHGRILSQSFTTSKKLLCVGDAGAGRERARNVFAAVNSYTDRDGLVPADPQDCWLHCKASAMWTLAEFRTALEALVVADLVRTISDVAGRQALWVVGFHREQKGLRFTREPFSVYELTQAQRDEMGMPPDVDRNGNVRPLSGQRDLSGHCPPEVEVEGEGEVEAEDEVEVEATPPANDSQQGPAPLDTSFPAQKIREMLVLPIQDARVQELAALVKRLPRGSEALDEVYKRPKKDWTFPYLKSSIEGRHHDLIEDSLEAAADRRASGAGSEPFDAAEYRRRLGLVEPTEETG